MPKQAAFFLLLACCAMGSSRIEYSEKYADDNYEYRYILKIAVYDIMLLLKRVAASASFYNPIPSNIIPHQIHQTRDFTQRHRQDVAKDSFTE
jgi:Cyclin-dependent kinase regulatory subunit